MIEIIVGHAIDTSGTQTKVYTPADGPISLSEKLERRWVNQGIARYVTAPAAPAIESDDDAEQPEQVADDKPEAAQPVEDAGNAETIDYTALKAKELKDEARARGLKFSSRATRDELIKLLEDSDTPPDLTAQEVE